jgi:NDP-4-keto-2,6-dideoxyhexose 3-C-methyltransferase
MGYRQVTRCRICGNERLAVVLDLGEQYLTGVFPRTTDETITRGPLRLVKCEETGSGACGLLQMQHSYDLGEMYGDNYGYRSGLNASMVGHLHRKVDAIVAQANLRDGDIVLDIGSNDGTTLSRYSPHHYQLVGIDPTGNKFREYYPAHVDLIPDFFSARLFKQRFGERKAKVVTSFSMFYDLEDPVNFMREIHDVLADDGLWVFEQSYMPTMLEKNSYDTVCHEHVEYYALAQIKWMADRVGFVITDVTFNDVNGGSFSVSVKKAAPGLRHSPIVDRIARDELALGLNTLRPFEAFDHRVAETKRSLRAFLDNARAQGQTVGVLGASTKGNVLLQYCDVTAADIARVGEVNQEKWGRFTPGTHIPIVAEDELLAMNPRYLLVLPWHFRDHFVASRKFKGKSLVFPLPKLEIVDVP